MAERSHLWSLNTPLDASRLTDGVGAGVSMDAVAAAKRAGAEATFKPHRAQGVTKSA
jgi:hypothetical protein